MRISVETATWTGFLIGSLLVWLAHSALTTRLARALTRRAAGWAAVMILIIASVLGLVIIKRLDGRTTETAVATGLICGVLTYRWLLPALGRYLDKRRPKRPS